MEEEVQVCEHCGSKFVPYKYVINMGLCESLRAVAKQGPLGTEVSVGELNLPGPQYGNFQRLRHWGLIEQVYTNELSQRKGGYCRLTKLGRSFLLNQQSIPKRVTVLRNQVTDHSDELIYINDVNQGFQWKEDFVEQINELQLD